MATEILTPRDCLSERNRYSSHKQRGFQGSCSSSFSYPKSTLKKPSPLPKKRDPSSKRSPSIDDSAKSKTHLFPAKQKVVLLRRGESLDSKIKGFEAALKKESPGNVASVRNDSIGMRSPSLGAAGIVYAGSAFSFSPEPSALPLPSFPKKKSLSVDDCATRDLRRLLNLEF